MPWATEVSPESMYKYIQYYCTTSFFQGKLNQYVVTSWQTLLEKKWIGQYLSSMAAPFLKDLHHRDSQTYQGQPEKIRL